MMGLISYDVVRGLSLFLKLLSLNLRERESKKKNLLALAFILESSEQHLLFIKKCARVSKTASDGLRFILSARRIFIYLALSSFELSSIVLESCPFGLFQRENQLSLKKD